MRTCAMCGVTPLTSLIKEKDVCPFCGFDLKKPLSELTEGEISDLMASYDYTVLEDGGYRIEGVKNIRDIALRGFVCTPRFITEIGDEAYCCCKFLAGVELHDGLRSIGNGAFAHCRNLFDMFIPATVTHMGKAVFEKCDDLEKIYCAASEKPDGWDDAWLEGCDATVEWNATID